MPATQRGAEPGERSERLAHASAARARRHRALGLVLIVVGVAIWVPFIVLAAPSLRGHTTETASAVGLWTLIVSLALVTRGRRMRIRGAELALAEDQRPPIVYLRPFDADRTQIAVRMWSRLRVPARERFERTYEERLARTLRKAGPFVAVGDPTERLPLLGAARVYVDDEHWRDAVGELIARASLVVLHVGESQGVVWEVHHTIALGDPERVVLSLPLQGKRKERSRQDRYDAFVRGFGDAFPRPLPDRIGECQFLCFDADWVARPVGGRDAAVPAGDTGRAIALRRLAREFRITWAPYWLRLVVYFAPAVAAWNVVNSLVNT